MPPGNKVVPTPAQRDTAGRLLREARRRRELTLIEVARRAHYSNHQIAHHWESSGPPSRDRSRLLTIVQAYALFRIEADSLLTLCGHLDPLSDGEWREYGDPPDDIQPLMSPGDADRGAVGSFQGQQQGAGPGDLPVSPSNGIAPLAERRQVTVLKCYLSGVSGLADRLSRQDLLEVLDAFQGVCAEVVDGLGGHIHEQQSDSLMACFGYPISHEDDAQRAVRAGLLLIEGMNPLNQRIETEHGVRLAVSVAGNTAHGIFAEPAGTNALDRLVLVEGGDAIGLMAYAVTGGLVIGEATFRLIEGFFACQRLEIPVELGQSSPLRSGVYRVLRESGVQGRVAATAVSGRMSPLMGRQQEFQALLNSWRRLQEGLGQTVLLRGDPGIGKSRLVQVLKEKLAAEPKVVLEGQCLEMYRQSPLHPVIEMLEGLFELSPVQTPDEKLKHLEQALSSQDSPGLEAAAPLLASLLSLPLPANHPQLMLPPSHLRQKTLEAVVNLLLHLAEQQPVLFILEDLHWADASTLDLLGLLVEHTSQAPVLALLTFRPEFQPPPWVFRDHVSGIRLEPLSGDAEELLIEHLLGGASLTPEAYQHLLARTGGVPLYIEELVKLVLDSHEGGPDSGDGRVEASAIPAALEGGLTARLDRLPGARIVAQVGAAIGQSFSYRLLQSASTQNENVTLLALSQLVESGMLHRRGLPPDATYFFKHALIRDQAYLSLTGHSRMECHRRIGEALYQDFTEIVDTSPEILAHHYTEAGLTHQAISYWHLAGEKARQSWANTEAINHISKGLDLIRHLPNGSEKRQQELMLQMTMGASSLNAKGPGSAESGQAYNRALEICRINEDGPYLFPAVWGLYNFHYLQGNFRVAQELTEQLLRLAEKSEDPHSLVVAYYAAGDYNSTAGMVNTGREYLEKAASILSTAGPISWATEYGIDVGSLLLGRLAMVLWLSGYPEQGLHCCFDAVKLTEGSANPVSVAIASAFAGIIHVWRGETSEARECADTTINVSLENEFPFWLALGLGLRGWAKVLTGEGQAGVQEILRGMNLGQRAGTFILSSFIVPWLAEAHGIVGNIQEGLATSEIALAEFENLGAPDTWVAHEVWRIKGELLIKSEDSEIEAESCFRRSLDISRRQGAKLPELRATMGLCRLLQKQDQTEDARELLSEIYGWFTEGFETADLIEARQLLDELS